MRISAEQFADLTQSFGHCTPCEPHEKRRAARVKLSMRVTVTLVDVDGGQKIGASLCDFSARGLAILLPQQLKSGSQFITHLPRKTGGMVNMLCTVAHSREVSRDLWRTGAEFTCTLPSAPTQTTAAESDEAKRIRESMLG